jgi:hypothetical protein
MTGVSLASWLALAGVGLLDARSLREVLYGMLGPLAVAIGAWVLMERAYRRGPRQLTRVMVVAFAFKLIFFGAYVAVMLRVLSLRPVPFVASFTGYFVVLYVMEALYLKRLFAGGPAVP